MTPYIPQEAIDGLGTILPALAALGYAPTEGSYWPESFGDYFVTFTGPHKHTFRIILDRGQYIVDGQQDELTNAGLWQAFNRRDELETRLLDWIRSRNST